MSRVHHGNPPHQQLPDHGADAQSADAASSTESAEIMIGIPAYNEAPMIGSVVLGAREHGEVVVVDDGSTDRTAELAKAGGANVVQHETNSGKGQSIKTLLSVAQEADVDALVLLDGDGQHYPEDIRNVVRPILDGEADIVVGSRYLERRRKEETPSYRRVGQRCLDLLTSKVTELDVSDSQSGFRALSEHAIERIDIRTDGFAVESQMLAAATTNGLRVTEAPIDVRYENIETDRRNPVTHFLSVALPLLVKLVLQRYQVGEYVTRGRRRLK
ncbi:glycosyltransferase family 2 protein [Halorarius litoreus]|uniref:glycosyltransferase family 2 protein n=1 Tax=Halorarius litoreus TaxID=2962676 RepID=UPI0020CCC4E4|nr:glycosyltransferase family 2 protein [Halorarius litoreus]